MLTSTATRFLCLVSAFACIGSLAQESPLNTLPLAPASDRSAQMVAGIEKFLLNETEHSIPLRPTFWHPDFSSWQAYENSVAPNRARFLRIIGAVDHRLPVGALEFEGSTSNPAQVAETDLYTVHAVRWPVFQGVFGEGLW